MYGSVLCNEPVPYLSGVTVFVTVAVTVFQSLFLGVKIFDFSLGFFTGICFCGGIAGTTVGTWTASCHCLIEPAHI